jgi:hypothetical protein
MKLFAIILLYSLNSLYSQTAMFQKKSLGSIAQMGGHRVGRSVLPK